MLSHPSLIDHHPCKLSKSNSPDKEPVVKEEETDESRARMLAVFNESYKEDSRFSHRVTPN